MKGKNNENNKKKKTIIIAVVAACFVIAGVFAGLMLTKDTDAKEAADLKANEIEIVTEDGKVEVVDKDSKEADEYKEAVKSGDRENVTAVKKDKNKNSSSSSSSSSNSNNSNSSNKNDSNKNNNSTPSKPSHTHSWTAVYATKQVQVGTEEKCVDSIIVCNCGARNVGKDHAYAHTLAGEPSNTHIEEIWEDVPVYETQKYVDYYKCSCGATK